MTEARVILTTADSLEQAQRIAEALVTRRLAACVNIVPKIISIYRWKGNMEKSEECLLIIKSTASAFGRVRDAIRELHSYDTPECICFGIEDGAADYLAWIAESVG